MRLGDVWLDCEEMARGTCSANEVAMQMANDKEDRLGSMNFAVGFDFVGRLERRRDDDERLARTKTLTRGGVDVHFDLALIANPRLD
ncbi:hypothetical protein Csa_012816 [Cucumis sativus]|nr:hypothetical protein Csa_012816 [Cucumis sativus]